MTKYIIIITFFILLNACSAPNENPIQPESTLPKPIVLPSKKDFPFVEKIPDAQIFALKEQIKNNNDIISILSPNEILNLLGAPVVIKNGNNIEIWQFRKHCILNIIWDKNKNINTATENIDTNNIVNKTPNYSIVWLESLTPNKKDLKAIDCFYYLANIDQ